jgi:hypothetical protein
MSSYACSIYGIDTVLFGKVCPPDSYTANFAGFARIYISGLHIYVTKIESELLFAEKHLKLTVEAKDKEIELLQERLEDKDAVIALLTPQNPNESYTV